MPSESIAVNVVAAGMRIGTPYGVSTAADWNFDAEVRVLEPASEIGAVACQSGGHERLAT